MQQERARQLPGKNEAGQYELRAGDKYGSLTVLDYAGSDENGRYWLFRCECGRMVTRHVCRVARSLKLNGNTACAACRQRASLKRLMDLRESRRRKRLREDWDRTGTLYSANDEAQMADDIRAELEMELGCRPIERLAERLYEATEGWAPSDEDDRQRLKRRRRAARARGLRRARAETMAARNNEACRLRWLTEFREGGGSGVKPSAFPGWATSQFLQLDDEQLSEIAHSSLLRDITLNGGRVEQICRAMLAGGLCRLRDARRAAIKQRAPAGGWAIDNERALEQARRFVEGPLCSNAAMRRLVNNHLHVVAHQGWWRYLALSLRAYE